MDLLVEIILAIGSNLPFGDQWFFMLRRIRSVRRVTQAEMHYARQVKEPRLSYEIRQVEINGCR